MPNFPQYILAYELSSSTEYLRWKPVHFPEIIPSQRDITLEVGTFVLSFDLKNSEKGKHFPHFTQMRKLQLVRINGPA